MVDVNKFQVLVDDENDPSLEVQSEPTHQEELGNDKLAHSDSECTSPRKRTKHRNKKRPVTPSDRITRTAAKSLATSTN